MTVRRAARTFAARARGRLRAFLAGTRAGATAIAAAAVTVMTVGAAALITDHVWLVDQRDVLKTAAEAASLATTLLHRRALALNPNASDKTLEKALVPVAKRYVLANLAHLAPRRFQRAKKTLRIKLKLDRSAGTVAVTAKADLGGTLFSRALPLLGNYTGPKRTVAKAGVESKPIPVEVVLAIDTSYSMGLDLQHRRTSVSKETRMALVKRAARHLVDILGPSAPDAIAVGVVPWDVRVRLDTTDAARWAGKGWAVYPASRTYPDPHDCNRDSCVPSPTVDVLPDPAPAPWLGCFDGHRVYSAISKVPAATADDLFEYPSAAPFAQSYWRPDDDTSYRCIDRATLPPGSLHICLEVHAPGKEQGNCSTGKSPMFALSTDPTDVKRVLGGLAPGATGGSRTQSSLGVLWAQRMLEPAWKSVWNAGGGHPADPSVPAHAKLRKAIVLLTDGEDTACQDVRPHDAPGCEGSKLAISRIEACDAAKSRGTEIFVVAAMHPDKISGALGQGLRDCSSENDKEYPQGTRRPGTTYVFLNNATPANLEAAFKNIANQLRTLRKVS